MRFFSRVTFICNCCFIAYVLLRWIELNNKKSGHFDHVILLPPLQNTLVITGLMAVVINLIFNVAMGVMLMLRIKHEVPKWIIWTNFLFLIAQLIFHIY